MQLLQDGVIAALAAVGLATIVWFTVTALTHPRERVAQLLCRESFDVTVCPQGDLARQFD